MTPFSDPYFYWQNTVRGDGIKVVTIVKLPNSEFPIVAGDVKEMREDLKKIAQESSRPGVDYRFTFAPVHNVHFVKYVYLPTEQAETYLAS